MLFKQSGKTSCFFISQYIWQKNKILHCQLFAALLLSASLCFVGFKSAFPLKSTQSALPPPPPPGLGSVVSKPPPGFTGIPLNSNVVESSVSDVNRLELIGVCDVKGKWCFLSPVYFEYIKGFFPQSLFNVRNQVAC